MHIFTISLAPNQKYFSFLGFTGDSHSQSVHGDGRFVWNLGFVFIDFFVVRRTRCNFSSKIELLFSAVSL